MGQRDISMLCSIRRTMFGQYQGHVLAISTITFLLDACDVTLQPGDKETEWLYLPSLLWAFL